MQLEVIHWMFVRKLNSFAPILSMKLGTFIKNLQYQGATETLQIFLLQIRWKAMIHCLLKI